MFPSHDQRGDEWIWLQHIAKDLVRLSKKHNLIIWTACQTNRGGTTADILDLSHAQGSIRHFQEATAVVSLKQVSLGGNDDIVGMQFFNNKQRQSKKIAQPVTLECNLSKMDISKREAQPTVVEVDKDEEDDTPPWDRAKTPRERQKEKQRKR